YRGEIDRAQQLDEDLLNMSQRRDDSAGLVLGHLTSGRTLMFAGRFAASRSHLEQVPKLYDQISHRLLVRQVGLYPHVNSQAYLANVLFCTGFPDQALEQNAAAVAEARKLAHPLSQLSSVSLRSVLLCLVGDITSLDERTDQVVAMATEH